MTSFNQISNNFKNYTQQRLNRLEREVNDLASDSDIDDLEAALGAKVEDTKEDINDGIDQIQQTITSRRPHLSDPDYSRKRAQYVQLLRESTSDISVLIEMSYGYPTQNHQNGSPHLAQGGGRQNQRTSNYMRQTTTTVEQQIRNRLPTLVLQLQQRVPSHRNNGRSQGYHNHDKLSNLSDRELDEYVASNLQDFKRELMNNIDSFHQTVLSARPNPTTEREDPEGYRIHREQYQEFLKLANELVKRMQESFNDILTRYREYIDQLWTAICQGQDVRHIQRQFEQHMQQNMARYWAPIFDRADQLIDEIDLNFNQHSFNPMPGYKPRAKH